MRGIISKKPLETIKVGRRLGAALKSGDVVALYGEMGCGKTTFVRGIVSAVHDGEDQVSSPTFQILNIYDGKIPVYHFDLYRLSDESELDSVDFFEYAGKEGISVIEWPQIAQKRIESVLNVYFRHGREANSREITFEPVGNRPAMALKEAGYADA